MFSWKPSFEVALGFFKRPQHQMVDGLSSFCEKHWQKSLIPDPMQNRNGSSEWVGGSVESLAQVLAPRSLWSSPSSWSSSSLTSPSDFVRGVSYNSSRRLVPKAKFHESGSRHLVDCPTQLICTWIFIYCVPWQRLKNTAGKSARHTCYYLSSEKQFGQY